MKKAIIIGIIIAIVIIIGVVIGLNNNDNNVISNTDNSSTVKTTKVKVTEVTRSVFYAPQYVALSMGFFEDEGIDVELTTGSGADTVMTSVITKESDIGFAGPEVAIYVYNEGKEDYMQVFAQLTKRDGSFLVSRTENNNFKWSDLKGKTIIPGRKGGVPYMTFEYVLKQNGLNPSEDVVLDDSIKFDLMAGAFAAGDADYVTLFEPTASLTELGGYGYIVASVGEAAGEIPYTAYFATKSYITEHEDVIQGFTNAIYKGQQWVKEHTAKEIAEKIQDFFPDSELATLETAVQSYMDIDAWNSTPVMTEDAFNRLQDVMIEAGELTEKVSYSDLINNKYAEKTK